MGGHGGLNILPQKKWNVYRRDNRLRVARDEEAAAANEKKKVEEERQREKDARYRALLEKQPQEQVVIKCEQQGIRDDRIVEDSRVQSEDVERLAAAARERGDPKTQTCDPRFDASFKFAKGMQEKPWWLSDTRDSVCDDDDDERREKTAVEVQKDKRSCLGYVKVKHGSRKSRAREKKKQKKEMYEVLRQERLEREARERNKMNSMILH